MLSFYVCFIFFFKQKTAYEMRISDWSSDVCSSDLTRGGVFIQDIVRVEDGVLSRPILMDLGFVNKQGLSALCRKYDVRIFDRTHFLPLGVPPAKSGGRLSRAREARRDYLKDIGCGQKPLRFTRTDWR